MSCSSHERCYVITAKIVKNKQKEKRTVIGLRPDGVHPCLLIHPARVPRACAVCQHREGLGRESGQNVQAPAKRDWRGLRLRHRIAPPRDEDCVAVCTGWGVSRNSKVLRPAHPGAPPHLAWCRGPAARESLQCVLPGPDRPASGPRGPPWCLPGGTPSPACPHFHGPAPHLCTKPQPSSRVPARP